MSIQTLMCASLKSFMHSATLSYNTSSNPVTPISSMSLSNTSWGDSFILLIEGVCLDMSTIPKTKTLKPFSAKSFTCYLRIWDFPSTSGVWFCLENIAWSAPFKKLKILLSLNRTTIMLMYYCSEVNSLILRIEYFSVIPLTFI